MLLVIDIGNTSISFGVFTGQRLIKRFSIPTKRYTIQNLRKSLYGITIGDSIVCSVVPAVSRILKADLKKLLHKRPYCLGEDVKVPIKNLYRRPKQVGLDRLVNAFAGIKLYGAPLIVVDFGTAITFDVISNRKEYLGGLILPGLGISLDALTERTALLPKTKLRRPREFIGRDTSNSILSGIVYGFAALTDELVERIKGRIGRRAKVIGTGGNIHLIRNYCKGIDRADSDLTIKGLNFIFIAIKKFLTRK
jgi:type III pantothenate kinase